MFGLFKKQIHEPLKAQRDELAMYPQILSAQIIAGEDCDRLSNGSGPFGSANNPIPVNGAMGEIKYLAKLRGKTGNALFFHRVGSVESTAVGHPVDAYEVVCLDGTQWGQLFFDMYHPRRSNEAPEGYSLVPFNKSLGMDLPIGFGVNGAAENFPYDLPDMIVQMYGNQAMGRHANDWLSKSVFKRPVQL